LDGGGNVPPQRALARELKRRGHDVHVITHDTQAESVVADGGTASRVERFGDLARAADLVEELVIARRD